MNKTPPRTVLLRNDTGSEYTWPTLQIESHAPGEVLSIDLLENGAVPFGFTEVQPPKTKSKPEAVAPAEPEAE